tara:strand:- start:30 stop:224 length:195 start_codon:yes stop_codon:yes gene_type:complete
VTSIALEKNELEKEWQIVSQERLQEELFLDGLIKNKASHDTNVTHYFKILINKGFKRHSTIEWE